MTTSVRFNTKGVGEKRVLAFDFSADLATGETLTGTVTSVTITVVAGTDGAAAAMLAGGNGIDASATKYLVPITGGIDGCDYDVVVLGARTTTATKWLDLGGILPVRAQ
jgi:hypothetical protein